MKKRILVIEDEKDIAELVKYNLEKNDYIVSCANDGEKGLALIKRENPRLVILDIMLPGIDGLEVARRIRKTEEYSSLPIVMLTAKSEESDVVVGLEIGADDYVTKPFSPKVLVSRVKAVLRRYEVTSDVKLIKKGIICIDTTKHKVEVSGKEVFLTPTEFKLLIFMAARPGVVLSRDRLLSDVFEYGSAIYDRTVDAHIKSLRKKLAKARNYIETIHGIGYRFKEI